MDKKTEALKLAEDALKRVRTQDMELVQLSMIALAALREALAEQPAQRTWVGLTDEEFQYCVELKNPESIAEEVEAKLKEKNA